MAKKKGTGNTGQLSLFGGSTTQQLNNQLADIERKITALYGSTYKYAAQLAQVRAAVNSGQEFTWQENPAAAKAIEQRLNAVANTLDGQLSKATERSFALGQASTEHALTKALGKDKATKKEVEEINADAAAEMRRRGADGHTYYTQKRGGVSISDKVWNITESTKLEIEIAIQNAALEGQSADDLARTIQQYLEHPERLFRSVRVKDPVTGEWTGEYRMSKAAQQCHPGQGVYRSSYKNALRLARTELTQAYRRAEWETYQDNPLITGYRIELSNNHTTTVVTKKGRRVEPLRDICDEMAGTQYPKTFLWTGWHPQCRCRMVPITITTDDFKERVKARHRGKLDEWKPKEQTTEMPAAFTKWVEDNKHRWQQPGHSAPFFIRDNYQQGNVAKGLDTRITAELEQARLAMEAAKAQEPPIPEPITDYDNEVMVLRSIAKTYELNITKMEAIRADGKDKVALRNEIDRLTGEWGRKQKEWDAAQRAAQKAYKELTTVTFAIMDEYGDTGGYIDDVMLVDFETRINKEKTAKNCSSSILRLLDIAQEAGSIAGKIQEELNKRRAKDGQGKEFKLRQYDTMDDEQKLMYLIDRLTRLYYFAKGNGIRRTWTDETAEYRAALATHDAKKIKQAITKATKAEKEIANVFDKHYGDKWFSTQMDAFKTGKQPEEMEHAVTTDTLAALLGVDYDTALHYRKGVEGFTFQWDYEIRKLQQGKKFNSKHGHTKAEVQERAQWVEEYLQVAPEWNGGTTYRGINIDDATLAPFKKVGYVFDMLGTSSWTTNEHNALAFANGKKNSVIFECRSKQPRGTSIMGMSKYHSEHEILCSQTAKWKVVSFQHEGLDTYRVICEPCN